MIRFMFLAVVLSTSVSKAEQQFVPIGPNGFGVLAELFAYERDVPLDARVVERQEHESYTREKIVFTGGNDQRVPGYFAFPTSTPGSSKAHPVVLLFHGLGHEKESWWQADEPFCNGLLLTERLLASGYSVLMLDAFHSGERMGANDFEHPGVYLEKRGQVHRAANGWIQTVKDYRRALDYLATRSEVDTSRVGAVGYSMGAVHSFILTAVDERLKVTVAAAPPTLALNGWVSKFYATTPEQYAPYIESTPLLMLIGRQDEMYSEQNSQQLFDLLASTNKNAVWYESGHSLPAEWTTEAADWIEKHLAVD